MDEMKCDDVVRRLDVVISLLLELTLVQGKSAAVAQKIYKLKDMGLAASEIGAILCKPTNYVTAALSRGPGSKKREETDGGKVR